MKSIFANVVGGLIMPFIVSSMVVITAYQQQVENQTYWQQREALLAHDLFQMLGSDLELNAEERRVNAIIMAHKQDEMQNSITNLDFPPSKSFFRAKAQIEESKLFSFIKNMPKGAVLHAHDIGLTSIDWVISELTYWKDLYVCNNSDNSTQFRFFAKADDSCDWHLVEEERAKSSTPDDYDQYLYGVLTIVTNSPEEDYPDINHVWRRMENAFGSLIGIVTYAPAWKLYLKRAFEENVLDNVLYLEFRGVLPLLYEKDGSSYSPMETVDVYDQIIRNFSKSSNGSFYGARFIYAPLKQEGVETVWEAVELVTAMRTQFPATVAGFDLVGQEDIRPPLKSYLEPLLALIDGNVSVPLFLHAGETAWQGIDSDENLFDAILLNSTRIGHGYAIVKHPALIQRIKEADIPLELCPISNQVLMLLGDLRNHPLVELISRGFPIVVSSDDPAVWGADPLSHDFYEAFFAFGGAKADLRFLKKLALNSIKYSSLGNEQRTELLNLWQQNWNQFIQNFLNDEDVILTEAHNQTDGNILTSALIDKQT